MNIMLISDDHGQPGFETAYKMAKKNFGEIDAVLHAGDSEKMNDDYYTEICKDSLFVSVKGNNDFNGAPMERVLKLGGKKIFLTHGHKYGVYMGVQNLYFAALERECDIVVYGHTHSAKHQIGKDVEIINPGSLTGIRSMVRSYAVLTINADGSTNLEFYNY